MNGVTLLRVHLLGFFGFLNTLCMNMSSRRVKSLPRQNQLVEVVDDNLRPMAAMPEALVHRQGLLHQRVVVLIFHEQRLLYIPRRSRNYPMCPLCWDVSLSLHQKIGRSLYETARQGMMTSLGLTVSKLRFLRRLQTAQDGDNEIISVYCIASCMQQPALNPDFFDQGMFLEAHELAYLVQSYSSQVTPLLKKLWELDVLFALVDRE